MQLREWQNHFQSAVLSNSPAAELPLREQGIARETSIGIYANAYRKRLHEALRSNYRAVHNLLGDSDFHGMAHAFIAAHPPHTASIRWFGAELANYLTHTPPFSVVPAIGELARFEWALRHTVDALDGARIEADYFHALDAERWETFTCALHPSLTVVRFAWNTPQIWHALDADEKPPLPVPLDSYWFIYRSIDLMTEWRSADAYEAEAIQLWSRDKDFGAICEFLAEKIGNAESAAAAAASFLRTWIQQGLLIHSQCGEKNNAHAH